MYSCLSCREAVWLLDMSRTTCLNVKGFDILAGGLLEHFVESISRGFNLIP